MERRGYMVRGEVYEKYTSLLQWYMENIPLLYRGIWKIYPFSQKYNPEQRKFYLLKLPKRLQICIDDF